MTWESDFIDRSVFFNPKHQKLIRPFKMNEQCFVRPEHECGKVFGASKSCFIACPSDDGIETILALISEKLQRFSIEPIIAVKERAYGKDIFCTKICGKIIESKFCLTILNDSIKEETNIPNPNVYYEYGLMTALQKYIIPLQKEELKLAFNIQSHDTIKYNDRNIATELDRAIRDAIKYTEATEKKGIDDIKETISERAILRDFEISGFEIKDDKWFLSEVIDDTGFKGFGHEENKFYLYLGLLDDQHDLDNYIEDLNIVIFRTEKEIQQLKSKQIDLTASIEQGKQADKEAEKQGIIVRRSIRDPRSRIEIQLKETLEKIELLNKIYVGFINRSSLDLSKFIKSVEDIISEYPRYSFSISNEDNIGFGEITVNLKAFKSL